IHSRRRHLNHDRILRVRPHIPRPARASFLIARPPWQRTARHDKLPEQLKPRRAFRLGQRSRSKFAAKLQNVKPTATPRLAVAMSRHADEPQMRRLERHGAMLAFAAAANADRK